MEIEKAIENSKISGMVSCPKCGDELYAQMDKLSINLYGKCTAHIEEDSHEEKNLFKLIMLL